MAPVPEMALQLLGRETILAVENLHEGYGNMVWRIKRRDESRFIVKRFRSRWARDNEKAALAHMNAAGLPVPTLFASTGSAHIYEDDGGAVPKALDPIYASSFGAALGRLHGSTPREQQMPPHASGPYSQLRAIREAADYRSPDVICPVHGDPHPGNSLVRADGGFQYLIDLEEYHLGDPAADLLQALMELCLADPAEELLPAMLQGYLKELPAPLHQQVLGALDMKQARNSLASTLYDGFEAWAAGEADPAKAVLYTQGRARVLARMDAFTFSG